MLGFKSLYEANFEMCCVNLYLVNLRQYFIDPPFAAIAFFKILSPLGYIFTSVEQL